MTMSGGQRFGAEIDVLYVWNSRTESRLGGRTIFFADSVAVASRTVDRCPSPSRAFPVQVRARLEFGELCSTIQRVAAAEDFDLIVKTWCSFSCTVADEVSSGRE